LDTWLSPVAYQSAFTRAHAFAAGRGVPMAKAVFVGPRMFLTGMNADEWVAAAPGTEGLLALALAGVIVRERPAPVPAAAGPLRHLLARHPAEPGAGVG